MQTLASRTSHGAAMAPVRPTIAVHQCFKAGVQAPRRAVAAQAAAAAEVSPLGAQPIAQKKKQQSKSGEQLVVQGMDMNTQKDLLKLPKGYHWYETMMILKPFLSDEERDRELAKFESFLSKEECMNINALVRGRARMAYEMKTYLEGIYVLYTYAAKRQTARNIQRLLSNPEVGSEETVLRHITFCKY